MRYDLNQLFVNPRTPWWSSFYRGISCSTVSKAFWKFTNIPQPILEWIKLSSVFSLLSIIVLLLNWFIRLVSFGEGFNRRELLILSKLWLFVSVWFINNELKFLLFKQLKGNVELEQVIEDQAKDHCYLANIYNQYNKDCYI